MGLFEAGRDGKLFARAGDSAGGLFAAATAFQRHEPGTQTFTRNVPIVSRREDPTVREYEAILRIEGGTGPNGEFLESSRGAIGPAQLRPRTAREAARLANRPWDEHLYRTDPEYNIALGHAYYREQLNDFHVPELAAAAYNWGPTALRAAIRESKRTGTKLENLMPAQALKYVASFRKYLEDE